MKKAMLSFVALGMLMMSCNDDDAGTTTMDTALNPDTAPKVSIDRFSEAAGTLMVRTASNGLPQANEPIDFDSGAPFITQGLTADGAVVQYYNFDVQPTDPAPIYLFFNEDGTAVEDQLNIVGVIPGDTGYNDFWQVYQVTVPSGFVANTVTSEAELLSAGLEIMKTSTVVNCPVVPDGSIASKRVNSEDTELHRGWYQDQVVYYFSFFEKILDGGSTDMVPLSPIYVSFNINPDDMNPDSGAASGFVTEMGTDQTHNVIATIPSDDDYSPLWLVNVYDNMDFDMVGNLTTAQSSNILATGVATVNCPVVTLN
ncbi:hypothetical protein [Neptunitalea lumnitzerae]|nr:hypothetical protein [Neptunitalea sp. Y10]